MTPHSSIGPLEIGVPECFVKDKPGTSKIKNLSLENYEKLTCMVI